MPFQHLNTPITGVENHPNTCYTGVMVRYPEPNTPQVINGQWRRPYMYIAGRLCIDFTHSGGEEPEVRAFYDGLRQPADFAFWLDDCPLHVSGVTVSPDEFGDALAVREAIWRSA